MNVIRTLITGITDVAGKIKEFAGRGLPFQVFTGHRFIQQYGFSSNPLPGARGLTLRIGNHYFLFSTDDPRYRNAIADGEVQLYTDEGDIIHFKRGMEIEIKSGAKVKVEAPDIEAVAGVQASVQAPEIEAVATVKASVQAPTIEATAGIIFNVTAPIVNVNGIMNVNGAFNVNGVQTQTGDLVLPNGNLTVTNGNINAVGDIGATGNIFAGVANSNKHSH